MKNRIEIVEEILQTVGLEKLGSTKSEDSQFQSTKLACKLTRKRFLRKKEIKETPNIKLGSHNA